ncbi:MAG TPA: EF-P beta-lysylation protein EpmB [Candidatus Saccharimonadia bacterium]|nr:EF-P beta-lysylation protein EpmB [Candidatus Saccharimonadia bacterium]
MIPATPIAAQPPAGWQRQWRDAVTDPIALLEALDLPQLCAEIALPAPHEFPLRVPRAFVARMRPRDARDPLLRQVLPLDLERRVVEGYSADAVGDAAAREAPGVIRKYAGRALLVATGSCAVHCRYCFRRHFPYADEIAARDEWRAPLDWLRAHPEIDELILSGGDPWSLSTPKLDELTEALRRLPQLKRLRIHTRLPVVLPARVDDELLAWLARLPWRVVVVLHANHANELDASVAQAAARLRDAGATLLNQSVLLRAVNDDVAVLASLSEGLFELGVLPYYLHQLDRVAGAAHFEVPDAEARRLRDALRIRLPGYLVPRLVRETAGEPHKTPL